MKFPWRFKDKPKPAMLEIGATGSVFFGGKLTEEEYNPDLKGEKAIQVYERMRRSDGQVKAALLACELPLRAAHWDIEPASNKALDQDIANFVYANLFEGMTITFDDFLRHILLMLPFGFSIFEKVWELKDNRYKWRKFAPRLPKTISEWLVDEEGGLAGVKQRVWKDNTYQTVEIPVEKLLVFTNNREGSNFQGVSLLRAAYKHWYYKDQLYRIDGIAAERHGVGLAVFQYPSATPKEDKDTIGAIGERLHAHERAYIALPDEIKFDLKGVAGQLHDIKGSIEHHDLEITRSILAQFINLGGGEYGSYALSQDQTGFFLMALQAVGRGICDTFNRYAIPQLVDYNWQVSDYPRLVVSGLEYYDVAKYSKAITDLVGAGLILPDENIEAEMRRRLHLPAKRAEKVEASEPIQLTEWRPRRVLLKEEQSVVFSDIAKELDKTTTKFIDSIKVVQRKQIKGLVDKLADALAKGNIKAISEIDVSYHDQLVKAIKGTLKDIYDYGAAQVREELKRQRGVIKGQEPIAEAGSSAADVYLETRARATATILNAKMRGAAVWQALSQARVGEVNRDALEGSLTDLSDRELKGIASFSVNEAFDLGRGQQAAELADDIDRVIYSAILDDAVCPRCLELDGKEYKYPSPEWDEVNPPLRDCEGRDRCRCVGVYVFKGETPGGTPKE